MPRDVTVRERDGRRRLLRIARACAFAAGAAAFALTAPVSEAASPATYEGPTGRSLLDGTWLLRRDPRDVGFRSHWQNARGRAGWTSVAVPNAFNAGDDSSSSMAGGVAWYRRDFRVPSPRGTRWLLRFESVRHRATVWLN